MAFTLLFFLGSLLLGISSITNPKEKQRWKAEEPLNRYPFSHEISCLKLISIGEKKRILLRVVFLEKSCVHINQHSWFSKGSHKHIVVIALFSSSNICFNKWNNSNTEIRSTQDFFILLFLYLLTIASVKMLRFTKKQQLYFLLCVWCLVVNWSSAETEESEGGPMGETEKAALYSTVQGFVGDSWNGSYLFPDPCGWTPIQVLSLIILL